MDHDTPALADRVAALERTLTDDGDRVALADAAALSADVAENDRRLDDLDERLTEVEAAVQALRGYAGAVP